jgi:hypothetical protein
MEPINANKEQQFFRKPARRRLTRALILFILSVCCFIPAKAQTSDLTQLILDIEKLTQLKGILSDMKTGYTIIDGGYNQVKSISQGNFNLHSTFLNGLLAVSPAGLLILFWNRDISSPNIPGPITRLSKAADSAPMR